MHKAETSPCTAGVELKNSPFPDFFFKEVEMQQDMTGSLGGETWGT